jgi:hypothetical protein
VNASWLLRDWSTRQSESRAWTKLAPGARCKRRRVPVIPGYPSQPSLVFSPAPRCATVRSPQRAGRVRQGLSRTSETGSYGPCQWFGCKPEEAGCPAAPSGTVRESAAMRHRGRGRVARAGRKAGSGWQYEGFRAIGGRSVDHASARGRRRPTLGRGCRRPSELIREASDEETLATPFGFLWVELPLTAPANRTLKTMSEKQDRRRQIAPAASLDAKEMPAPGGGAGDEPRAARA